MTKAGAFLCGFLIASAGAAAAWWFVAEPARRDAVERATRADRAAMRARHDEEGAEQWAESEHRRKLELEQEVETLKRTLTAEPPRPRKTSAMGGHGEPQPAGADLAPEQWDARRIRSEIMLVSTAPQRLFESPRYGLITRALKAHVDDSVQLLTDVMGSELPVDMKCVGALLFGALGDPRGVKPLLDARKASNDPELRRFTLRGLANLPGDEQTPVLLDAWNDPAADETTRRVAIHGLARRRHETALAVASQRMEGVTPSVRLQALQTLHAQARLSEWKDTALVPLFGKALLSADGDPQRKVSLLALEGFWSKDSVADLDAYAATAGPSELGARARKAADGIRTGTPRPEGAGNPQQKSMSPVDAEPGEPVPPQAQPSGPPAESKTEPPAPK
jgi:HEAT repeat protein